MVGTRRRHRAGQGITVGLGLLFLFLGAGCADLQNMLAGAPRPTARLREVRCRGLSLSGAALEFDVEVGNPYRAPLPLVNLDFRLSSGESRLLQGQSDLRGTIPAGGTEVVTLPAEVSLPDLVRFARGIQAGTAIPYDAAVRLGVDAPGLGRIDVPMDRKGELRLPALPGL